MIVTIPSPPVFCDDCPSSGGCRGACRKYHTHTNVMVPPIENARRGWICPRCDRVNSPDEKQCQCSMNPWGADWRSTGAGNG